VSSRKLRVLLAEDHQTVRDGIKRLVNEQQDMEVVAEAGDGREAARLAQELLPDVAVMDVSMPGWDGMKATERLSKACPQVKVLALTRHADYGFMTEMLKAGASGYVLKQSASEELIRALRAVAAGEKYLDPTITTKVVSSYAREARLTKGSASQESISDREEEALRLIALGYSNKEIARRLSISVKTVESHKANGMRKLGLGTRMAIVSYAIFRGWMQNT
jgi:two-component system response regulator NreC